MSSPISSQRTLKFRILGPTLIALCSVLLTPFTALQVNGHAFITEYAQPTSNLHANASLLNQLIQNYSYVTRLRTRMSPAQMTVDPTFVPQSGLPNVEDTYDLSNRSVPTTCSGFNLFLGSLGQGAYLLAFVVLILLIGVIIGVIFLIRRRLG